MRDYLPVLILLILIAGIVRADNVLTVLYLLVAVFIAGRIWSRNALRKVTVERHFSPNSFLDQPLEVQLRVKNTSLLPVIWLKLHESLPLDLIAPNYFREVTSLGIHGSTTIRYQVHPHKRGYYPLGPLQLNTGDILGVSHEEIAEIPAQYLTVYPKIVPLTKMGLPSKSPFGNIHERNPIFEDPSRIMGKRDYVSGDSLRRIDWKATAVTRKLQVKIFEASIALETCIFLNLAKTDYEGHRRFDEMEFAISVAASIANWAAREKHTVGFITNGIDLLANHTFPQPIPPRKGISQLMQVLGVLARIEASDHNNFNQLFNQASTNLAWGTTVVLITGSINDGLIDEMFHARKRGLNIAVIIIGNRPGLLEAIQRLRKTGFIVYHLFHLLDLRIWQG